MPMAFCSAKSRTLQVLSKITSAAFSDWRERIALGDELGGDGFAVALVHLASVGFDENAWHVIFRIAKIGGHGVDEKPNPFCSATRLRARRNVCMFTPASDCFDPAPDGARVALWNLNR